jgi:dTDP-4-dehydrorhamnose reductase
MGRVLLPQLQARGWAITAPSSRDLDITDERAVEDTLEAAQPEVILHLAAYTNVAQAEHERERCWAVNVNATRQLARASNHFHGAPNVSNYPTARFIHFSTDYVFDGEHGQYRESDTPNPSNYYGLTKTVGEEAALNAHAALIVRTSFKDSVWPYPVAFDDQFTSADYTDVIALEMLTLLLNLSDVSDNVLHIATERKSIFDLARRRNPQVQPGSRLTARVHIPKDVSLDTSRWQTIKHRLHISH